MISRKSRGRSRRNSMNFMMLEEKWHLSGNRMSKHTVIEDDSDNEEPSTHEVKDLMEEFFGRKSVDDCNSDQDVEVKLTNKQTLILSTLLPDEILLMETFDSTKPKHFVGVLLMADVSGYTALSERYSNTGKGGTYRLTFTLNTYLGGLIDLIYNHGGDVLKFAGDAFLALWKTDKRTFISHTIHTAITCALIIQHSFASYETDVKVNLKVKLAISAGNLIFSTIGRGADMNYVVYGLPVIEAKIAESVCSSGEVKLTPTAWAHCYSRNYDYILHENDHVTIKSILYDSREKDVSKPFPGISSLIKQMRKPLHAIENLPDYIWDHPNTLTTSNLIKRNETLNLRKTILNLEKKNIGSEIRKFMIRPVLTQVDAHQPLEYLTEMRQVSVLFVTLKPKDCQYLPMITIVNNAYQITCEIVYKSMGCVNKIILFDKDIMILVIFGLRGFKHESEAQAALKCAFSVKKSLSVLDGVLQVSIGVTTGQVYCGVVGHPLRREFTVIGATVNKAARLMCYFTNKITCDESTYIKSKMSSNGFTLQPEAKLKGINNVGKIYEYTEEIRVKELYDIPMIPPLLDRFDEMEYFQNWLDDRHSSYRDFNALLFIGESRIGKSRLIEWMARYVRNINEFHVCYVKLTSVHSATPYLALSQIFNQILELQEPITGFSKEEKLVQLLQVYDEDLCYLNNIIKVRFAYHESVFNDDNKITNDKTKTIFKKIISALTKTCVVFLDDLQNLDPNSWEFLTIMLENFKIFTVLTVTRGKFSVIHTWIYNVFIHNSIRKIVIEPLESDWIPSLACQMLDIDAVPIDLCNALKLKCKGVPGLIESFIVHLFSSGALEIKKISNSELEDWKNEKLQFPEQSLLHPQALNAADQETLDQLLDSEDDQVVNVCKIIQKDELNVNIDMENLDTLIMVQIDSLTPYQQLLLKISSVIGNVISRNLLENIMYENDAITTAKAVKRLFAMGIFVCANSRTRWHPKSNYAVNSETCSGRTVPQISLISCECDFEHSLDDYNNLPKYAFCKVMKFKSKSSRQTCYELLPMNQKKEFHTRIVKYLENNKQKCPSCGGVIMVVQSMLSLRNLTEFSETSEINKKKSNECTSIISSESSEEYQVESLDNISIQINDIKEDEIINSNKLRISNSEKLSIKDRLNDIKKVASHLVARDDEQGNSFNFKTILKAKRGRSQILLKRRSTKRVTMSNIYKIRSIESISNLKIFDKLRDVTEADKVDEWHEIGIVDSYEDTCAEKNNRISFSVKINKGVSNTDLSKCTCTELNIIIYEQLILHAKQAELKIKTIEFLIMYSYFNLPVDNGEIIFRSLEEAENLIIESQKELSKFEKQRFLGKIYTIRSAACLLRGNVCAAKQFIERATKIYYINLFKVSELFKIRSALSTKLKRNKYRQQESAMKSDSVYCLNVATLLYSTLNDVKASRTSALRALELVKKVNCNVVDMCDTFNNAIQLELDHGNADCTTNIERLAKEALRNLQEPVQANEMHAIGKLFNATFRARIARGQLSAAIRSGFRAIVISRFVKAELVTLDIIPDLFYMLLTRRRIDEAVDIVKEALRMGHNRATHNCELWYYALCIDMILDAGFQIETPNEITQFAEFMIINNRESENSCSRRRLIVGLWTYWLRADNERKAKIFETEALNWASYEEDDGLLTSLLSALRLAEGMIECFASKVDDLRKVVDLMALRSLADRELALLERDARNCRAVLPRWLLLKAYSLSLSGRHSMASTTFHQALDEARKTLNRLQEGAVQATSSNSQVWLQNAKAGNFPDWREGKLHAQTAWFEILYGTTKKIEM